MSNIIDEKLCRLCLNNYFPINNIFHDVSTKGCPIYVVLNFVYNLEISRDDGLPPNICEPCLWKVNEFEVYKINVNIAKKQLEDMIRKNSVQKEIDADELDIAREGNGSGEIIEIEAFHSDENLTEDDTIASNVMDISSETDPLKEELDAPEHYITAEESEIPNLLEDPLKEELDALEHCITAEESEIPNLLEQTIKSEIVIGETAIPVKKLEIENITEFVEGKRRLDCHHCGEKRDNKEGIVQHIEEAHKSLFDDDDAPHQDQRKHQMQIDERRYISESNFVKDEVVHSEGNPFICIVCSFSCAQSLDLKEHMKTHTGGKRYICNICSLSFQKNWRLQEHMKKHTGKYVCNICSYAFTHDAHLKVHMRKHTGEKPFICNVCGFSSSILWNLKTHMRLHTGEKPYRCHICSFSSSRNGNLKVHMRKHTGEKPYQCSICSFRCSLSKTLKTHLYTHS